MANAAGWMNVGGVTVVGTATITAASDLLTITAHGLADGDLVMVDTLSGGGAELRAGSTYVVRNPTANTFQLSTPSGNVVFDFTADGSAQVLSAVPSYAAVDLRRLEAIHLHPGSADRLGAREGVRPHSTAPVTVAGTTWTVAEGVAVVYPAETTTSGPYTVTYDATSAALDPADGTNPRLDGIDLQVQDDDEDGSGQRRPQIVYLAGTPASSPSPPPVTVNALRLATILVPAGGSPSPTVDSLAQYALGAGVLPVRTASERPTVGRYVGLVVWRIDIGTMEVWDGSAWATVASAAEPTFAESSTDIAGFTNTGYSPGTPVVWTVFTAPPSGQVYVTVTGLINSTTNTNRAELGWELREGGTLGVGTVILSPSVDRSVCGSHAVNTGATASIGGSHRYPILTGLTAGDTYHIRVMHRMQPAGTGNINYRSVLVEPVK